MYFSRKFILLTIVFFLFLPCFSINADTVLQPSGSGTESDPYQISNAGNLLWVAQDENRWDKHYIQVSNIDIGGIDWVPIGNTTVKFTGTYMGDYHTIQDLNINQQKSNYQGFFGYLENAYINGLVLENVIVNGNQYTGALAGYIKDSIVKNTSVYGTVNASGNNSGGLAGYVTGSIITNCKTVVTMTGTSVTGGLIGYLHGGSELRYSCSNGFVTGGSDVGGLVGRTYVTSTFISDCYSNAEVSGDSRTGGLIGYHWQASVYRSYSNGPVTGTGTNIGGLIGRSIGNAYYCYWDINSSGMEESEGGDLVFGKPTIEMSMEETFRFFNFSSLWKIDDIQDHPVFYDISDYDMPYTVFLADLEGSGTKEDPYIIQDASHLNAITEDLEAHYRLINDIDMKASVMWDHGRGFQAIGKPESIERFKGQFDGGGNTIHNLSLNRPNSSYQGLFGYSDGAVMNNINLENAHITGNSYTAAICGHSLNSFHQNISVQGIILSTGNEVGGCFGHTSGSVIHNVQALIEVFGNISIGGIIGNFIGGSELRHSFSNGIIIGNTNIGGLVGRTYTISSLISDCYSHAEVSGNLRTGGLIGYNWQGSVYRSYSTGPVTGTGDNFGGLIGRSHGNVYYCYWDTESSGLNESDGGDLVFGKPSADMQKAESFRYFNFSSLWTIANDNSYPSFFDLNDYESPLDISLSDLDGLGTSDEPYIIKNASELVAVSQDLGAFYKLGNDIDMTFSVIWDYGRGWKTIGSPSERFTGSIDGNGHTIVNLCINRPNENYQGLFGYSDGAVIDNINLENANITGKSYTGAICGHSLNSLHQNISVQGIIVSPDNEIGGCFGLTSGSIIHNAQAFIEVFGIERIGGIVGNFIGGSELRHSFSNGIIIGDTDIGGLVGRTYTSSSLISDCYSHAEVSGNFRTGGLIGYIWQGSVYRSYSTGAVTGTGDDVGGLIGRSLVNVYYCYWDTESSGLNESDGGDLVFGKPTADMQKAESFRYFNFSSLWTIANDNSYPSFFDLNDYGSPIDISLSDLDGLGTSDGPYIIKNASELVAVSQDPGAFYKLGNDIDMTFSYDHK